MFRRVHSGALGDNNPGARVNQESILGRYRRQLYMLDSRSYTESCEREHI